MADIAAFLPQVLAECPQCPDPVAELAVLNALRDFCAHTGYWREDQLFALVTDEGNPGEYTLTLTGEQALESVISPIIVNNKEVPLKGIDWLQDAYHNWRTATGAQAEAFTMLGKLVLRLVPYPTVAVADGMRVTKVLKPSPSATTVDDIVFNDWYEEIGFGAKARLMIMKDKPWENARAAGDYAVLFEQAKEAGFAQALEKWQDRRFERDQRVRGHYF